MATIPTNPPANPISGAIYIDTTTNFAYVWTGNTWVRATGGSSSYNTQITTGATILPGYFASPSPKDFVPQIGVNEPTTPYAGQLWTDTNQTPSPTYIWDGLQWVVISDGATTNTIVGSVPPTDPDIGDTFYETTTDRFYIWDGSAWNIVGGGDTHSFAGTGGPSLSLRPTGGALMVGDQYVDVVGLDLYVWTGSSWTPISGGGLPTSGAIVTYATAPPVGVEGAVYYNTTTDIFYVSDGTSWVTVSSSGPDTHSFTGTANPTLTTRPDATPLLAGDQYINTSLSTQFYYNGTAWVPVGGASSGTTIVDGTGTNTHTPAGGQHLVVSTATSNQTVTLPVAPAIGDTIIISDGTNNAASNNINVNASGGALFQSQAGPLIINSNSGVVRLTWTGISSVGWIYELG